MDKKFIKVLIEEGRPIIEMQQEEALTKLNNEIMTVYVMNGLHRGMQAEAFREEVRASAVALYQELKSDPSYKTIRDKEIQYIFSNGMKGRLNSDKDFSLTYKSLLRWVEGYVNHQERKDALRSVYEAKRVNTPKLEAHVTTDKDLERMTRDAWNDFKQYRQETESRISKQVKTIGSLLNRVPIACMDYSGMRIGYLRRSGMASETESLIDVFQRIYDSGKEL